MTEVTKLAQNPFLFSRSVMCNSLQPNGLQDSNLPCPSSSPRACSNSSPLSQWCHPTISSSVVPFSSCLNLSQHQRFSNEINTSHQVVKVLELQLQLSPSNEYSGLISFRMDWFDILAVRDSQEPSPTPQFRSINSSVLGFLYGPTLMSLHDYWKNHSFD